MNEDKINNSINKYIIIYNIIPKTLIVIIIIEKKSFTVTFFFSVCTEQSQLVNRVDRLILFSVNAELPWIKHRKRKDERIAKGRKRVFGMCNGFGLIANQSSSTLAQELDNE